MAAPARSNDAGSFTPSLPLAQLLGHAADAVAAVSAGRSLDAALAECPGEARPGAQALAFAALRALGSAEVLLGLLAPKAPPPAVAALLRLTLALLWADAPAYPPHTLVDQAVAAARHRTPHAAGFVNAVLRRFGRERASLVAAALQQPVARFNHPAWWLDRLRADWPDAWPAIVAADNEHPPLVLRVNARRGSVAAYLARLAEAGIAAHAAGETGIVVERPLPAQQLPGFAAGDVSVQDLAAQRAAPLLAGAGLARGARVLDACAAPGGKTAHLLELAELELLAIDRDAVRLARVDETLRRLGLGATTRAADAARPETWWDGRPFDAILLDAPCSASGVVRRTPDIRWLRRAGDIEALAERQRALLEALWPTLAPGGRLLYCTCSVFRAEGQAQIDAFLQRQGDARVPASPASPGHLLPLSDNRGAPSSAALPGADPGDGFFLALLEKRSPP